MKRHGSLEERFWRYVHKTDGCWLWTGTLGGKGYGSIRASGNGSGRRMLYAHRVAYELQCGPVPDGMYVCHHCDNPLCVRGDHLFVGTQADNLRDMCTKGRARTKLTEQDVAIIRQRYATEKGSQQQLASEFGVTQRTVAYVVSYRTWRHVRLEEQ